MTLTIQQKLREEAMYYGLKCDFDFRITKEKIEIAEKYAEIYCRNGKCEYDYGCCSDCDSKRCSNSIPRRCKVFLCSFILKKIPDAEVKKLGLEFIKYCWDEND